MKIPLYITIRSWSRFFPVSFNEKKKEKSPRPRSFPRSSMVLNKRFEFSSSPIFPNRLVFLGSPFLFFSLLLVSSYGAIRCRPWPLCYISLRSKKPLHSCCYLPSIFDSDAASSSTSITFSTSNYKTTSSSDFILLFTKLNLKMHPLCWSICPMLCSFPYSGPMKVGIFNKVFGCICLHMFRIFNLQYLNACLHVFRIYILHYFDACLHAVFITVVPWIVFVSMSLAYSFLNTHTCSHFELSSFVPIQL